MSYDIRLANADGSTAKVNHHYFRGGTYTAGGSNDAWLNITYNYSAILSRVIPGGIRGLYGLSGEQSIPILKAAIEQLSDELDADYWKATEGNVKRTLEQLLYLAKAARDAMWEGD